ncbi:protein serine/threonine kinase, putative [Entamoeba invadens IP1]|uniref:protein serine/threonine kinase, putative n=1 Tax=Entamoeba invadens IP1 TaxID=370355 RepID=UPI0002C3EB16|nr:protein serine/threonine kinase, putative [Entamoeba invadens IP1]ELP90712.1 protein serine/threonine kinase, putative [Entamoeba invadens IP1]|eukprot:XP_004257483.1 protein serine/threonine kinase, putative [Entamoeba invadens IP1]
MDTVSWVSTRVHTLKLSDKSTAIFQTKTNSNELSVIGESGSEFRLNGEVILGSINVVDSKLTIDFAVNLKAIGIMLHGNSEIFIYDEVTIESNTISFGEQTKGVIDGNTAHFIFSNFEIRGNATFGTKNQKSDQEEVEQQDLNEKTILFDGNLLLKDTAVLGVGINSKIDATQPITLFGESKLILMGSFTSKVSKSRDESFDVLFYNSSTLECSGLSLIRVANTILVTNNAIVVFTGKTQFSSGKLLLAETAQLVFSNFSVSTLTTLFVTTDTANVDFYSDSEVVFNNIKETVTFDYCVLSFHDLSDVTFWPNSHVKVHSCSNDYVLESIVESGAYIYLFGDFINEDNCNSEIDSIELYRECFAVVVLDALITVSHPSILEPPIFNVLEGNTQVYDDSFQADGCFDLFGYIYSYELDETETSKLVANGTIQRICPNTSEPFNYTAFCFMNGTNFVPWYDRGMTDYPFTAPNCPYPSYEDGHLLIIPKNNQMRIEGIPNWPMFIDIVGDNPVDVIADTSKNGNEIFLYGNFRLTGEEGIYTAQIPKCSELTEKFVYFGNWTRYFLTCKDYPMIDVDSGIDTLDVGLGKAQFRVLGLSNMPLVIYSLVSEDYTLMSPEITDVGVLVMSRTYFNYTYLPKGENAFAPKINKNSIQNTIKTSNLNGKETQRSYIGWGISKRPNYVQVEKRQRIKLAELSKYKQNTGHNLLQNYKNVKKIKIQNIIEKEINEKQDTTKINTSKEKKLYKTEVSGDNNLKEQTKARTNGKQLLNKKQNELFKYSEYVYFVDNTMHSKHSSGGKHISHKFYKGNSEYSKCGDNTEDCVNATYAINCAKNYFMLKMGVCLFGEQSKCRGILGGICLKTTGYFDYKNGEQVQCDATCLTCNKESCEICADGKTLIDGKCEDASTGKGYLATTNGVIACSDGYFDENKSCKICSEKYTNCEMCDKKKCIKCKLNYIVNITGNCEATHCAVLNKNVCMSCENGYVMSSEGKCFMPIDNCLFYQNSICLECLKPKKLFNGNCVDVIPNIDEDSCLEYSEVGCLQCKDGFYTENTKCVRCNVKCKQCTGNAEKCQDCIAGTVLQNGKCLTIFELEGICKQFNPSGSCISCVDGYYVDDSTCSKCSPNCKVCTNSESCDLCETSYFKNESSHCESVSELVGCKQTNENGCYLCENNYFLSSWRCETCSQNCKMCNSKTTCEECLNNWELKNNQCVERLAIDNCKSVINSYCTKCNMWHALSHDKTACKPELYKRTITIVVCCVIVVIIIAAFLMVVIGRKIIKSRLRAKERKEKGVISMSENSVLLTPFGEGLSISQKQISYVDQVEVNKETVMNIVLGNATNDTTKLQITTSQSESLKIEIKPDVVLLRKGECCTFSIAITPYCSGEYTGNLAVVYCYLKSGDEMTEIIPYSAETVLSTWIDENSIKNMKQIGKGSFGVVYKGKFKGNKVAVKKLNILQGDSAFAEFENEVEMLEKMKSNYIIKFFGAVHVGNSRMIVMEMAPHGSLSRLIEKVKSKKIPKKLRMKFCLDSSKGIAYLHQNGILHRDIKPGNILITALSFDDEVNAKLSDFGSSRNVNRAAAFDMTFTCGIGTPIYMSPEILNSEKYQLPADIYAFAVTIYETSIWGKAYTNIKFAFQIANHVCEGKRPDLSTVDKDIADLVQCMWKQDPAERIKIDNVVERLEIIVNETQRGTEKEINIDAL